ncbi:MAG TPA: phosphatidate cytidylyltransferase [Chitinophagaceae bacterium]|jgi:phosphatidate cytidylyltransferase|nr:phosphatidate cytidylyltransferase [Chitinophagaceae bacterium]
MAFNWQTFRIRTISSLIFVAVMLTGLLWNQWSFLVLFSVIHFGCWWEFLKLTEKMHNTIFHPYTRLGLMVMGYGLMLWFCGPPYHINGYGIKANISLPVSAAGFALLVIGIFQKDTIKLKAIGLAIIGFLYISLTLGMMIGIYGFALDALNSYAGFDEDQYPLFYRPWLFPLAIIVALWINDTMAYLVGSMIGRTPMTKISPKKTWEGTIGGIVLSTGLGFLIPFVFNIPGIDPGTGLVIALAAALTGTLGDLFESKLKRMAGVKDSGSIMPGHGGFLDRFDSLLFAIPVCWVFLYPCAFQC